MKNAEQNIAKSFSLVKKDINRLYAIVEELKLSVNELSLKKATKKKGKR